jgi:phage terminase large subunit
MAIKINKKYQKLYTTKKRIILLTGGRRSGKSFVASDFITRLTFQKNHHILYTRYTMTSAEKSIIPEFREKIDLLNAQKFFQVNKKDVTNNLTGSDILFSGIKSGSGNQTANLKSLKDISTFVLDEAEEEKDYDEWERIHLSVSNNKVQNRDIIILNPTTVEHWIWEKWFDGYTKYIDIDGFKVPITTHPNVEHIHSTYLDNIQNLPASYIEEIQRMKINNPKRYQHVILGGWLEKAEGVIFDNWIEGLFDESLPDYYGLDFGFSVDPDALIRIAVNEKEKKIYLQEKLYQNGLGSDQLYNTISPITKNKEIIGDNSEPRLINDLKKKGANISSSIKGADSIRAGIKIMQDYTLIVDPNSHNLKKELNNYVWSDKKSETPVDDYNHLIDAARGAIFTKHKKSGSRTFTTGRHRKK